MDLEFTIRPMLPSDERKLREIVALSFSRFMGFFAVHSLLSEEGQVLVADIDGTSVGFAKQIEFQICGGKYGCLLWIAVHPNFRQRGFALALTNASIQQLRREGAKMVFASTQRRNKAALATLSKAGFERASFFILWRIFKWRTFELYKNIWLAPGEVVLMNR